MRKAVFIGFFSIILVIACLFRFVRLGHLPYSLYWDEEAMRVDVKSILTTGNDMHNRPWNQVIYPSYGDYKLPVYIWFATLSAKVFGISDFSLRLPSALAGIGTVLVGGYLARECIALYEKKQHLCLKQVAQLSTMLVIAICPWSILFSRTGFEGHVGQFFLALSIACLFFAKYRKCAWYLSPFFAAVATYSYFSVRFVWIILFIFTALVLLKGSPLRMVLIKMGIPLLVFALLLLPLLRSPLYGDSNRFRLGTDSILKNETQGTQSNVYRQMSGDSKVDKVFYHRMWLTARELFTNYSKNTSLDFLFLSGDPNLRHGTGREGLFLLVFLPFFFLGLVVFFLRKREIFFFLLAWWLVALLPASVPLNTPHALRSLNALVPLSILIGMGLTVFLTYDYKTKMVKFFSILSCAFLLFFFTAKFTFDYFILYPANSASSWQNGYTQLAQELYRQKNNQESVTILPFDDRFYLWLMAEGPYTGKDFHTWKTQDYKFNAIPNFTFQEPDPDKITTTSETQLIAGQIPRMKEFLSKLKNAPKRIYEVKGDDGQTDFIIAEVGK